MAQKIVSCAFDNRALLLVHRIASQTKTNPPRRHGSTEEGGFMTFFVTEMTELAG
jgi:hypothetical protein